MEKTKNKKDKKEEAKKVEKETKKKVTKKTSKKESKNSQDKKTSETKETAKESFFKNLEEKFFETASAFLKKGVVTMALRKIDDVEEKMKQKAEERFNFYKNKAVFIVSILVASLFLVYGLVQNAFIFLEMERFTNIFFGLVFLTVAFVFYQKEK